LVDPLSFAPSLLRPAVAFFEFSSQFSSTPSPPSTFLFPLLLAAASSSVGPCSVPRPNPPFFFHSVFSPTVFYHPTPVSPDSVFLRLAGYALSPFCMALIFFFYFRTRQVDFSPPTPPVQIPPLVSTPFTLEFRGPQSALSPKSFFLISLPVLCLLVSFLVFLLLCV